MVRFYARQRRIRWKWQAIDSKAVASPLGGAATGRNPTDRGKSGAKVHILVDERGAPLAIDITGANQHDKWSVDDLIISVVVGTIVYGGSIWLSEKDALLNAWKFLKETTSKKKLKTEVVSNE